MKKNIINAAVIAILLFVIQTLILFIPKLALLAAILQTILSICGCLAIGIVIVKFIETLKF